MQVYFEIGATGAKQAAHRQDVCIVVDVLRASSSIIAAFMAGFSNILLADDVTKIKNNMIAAGEDDGVKAPGCHYGNSPVELFNAVHQGELVFFSTNGAPCIMACAQNNAIILIGAIVNATAVSKTAVTYATKWNKNISIILAGCHGVLEHDDLIAGSLIYSKLNLPLALTNQIRPVQSDNIFQDLLKSAAGRRLINLGYQTDIEFCAKEDITMIVPKYQQGNIIIE